MLFNPIDIQGPVVIELQTHDDDRGGFARTFCADEFADAGLPTDFPQCNLSINNRVGTLRGMHFNVGDAAEAKVVRCVRGALHDVIVDLRAGSATRFASFGVDLTADNRLALFVPEGFAHGFITLEDETDVHYHMGDRYRPNAARGIRWDDPALALEWPIKPSIMSATDAAYDDIDIDSFDLATFSN